MTENQNKPAVMVAQCLSGDACRYHGCAVAPRRALLARLAARYRIVFFCPEQAGGLPTPRPASRWHGERLLADGRDVTAAFHRGAQLALELALQNGIERFYGLRWSPSCDPKRGVTTFLLKRHNIKCFFG